MMTNRQKICLAALAKQSLLLHRGRRNLTWRMGPRGVFSTSTVYALIRRGLARRLGDRVVGVLGANDNGPR
jgi:hypothetical protein